MKKSILPVACLGLLAAISAGVAVFMSKKDNQERLAKAFKDLKSNADVMLDDTRVRSNLMMKELSEKNEKLLNEIQDEYANLKELADKVDRDPKNRQNIEQIKRATQEIIKNLIKAKSSSKDLLDSIGIDLQKEFMKFSDKLREIESVE